MSGGIDEERLVEQEATFGFAFASGELEIARPLYHPDVTYVSPTVRLFDAPTMIQGVDATLAFVARTVEGCSAIEYAPQEWSLLEEGRSAFVRIHFDWDMAGSRLRSNYVVLYRYAEGRIVRQELFYDPGGRVEQLGPARGS